MTSQGARAGDTRAHAPGALEAGSGAVEFTIFAPGKKRVALLGDFNGWDPSADPLHELPGGYWSIEKSLGPGAHEYLFDVDGVVVCDPYALEVTPSPGARDHCDVRSVARVGKATYEWRNGRPRLPFGDLVIYETHVNDFSPAGTFQEFARRLDYIERLGVNAIELMPVCEASMSGGWGYDPTCFFAVNRVYGTADDLRALIDEAHGRGIAVILDIVLAHTDKKHPFYRLYPPDESPWYGDAIGGRNQFGLPDLDYRKEPVQRFARDVQEYWLGEFLVDGFRYDYARIMGIDGDEGLPRVVRQAREVYPEAYLVGEWVPENPLAPRQSGCDAMWHNRFTHAMKALLRGARQKGFTYLDFLKSIETLDWQVQGYRHASQMVNYIESHDEYRLANELEGSGVSGDDARRRMALGAAVLLTAPGVPMIWHGGEFGEATQLRTNRPNPLHWDLLDTPAGQALFEHYRRLIALRKEHAALRGDGFAMEGFDNNGKWVVYRRFGGGEDIVVCANFAPETREVRARFPRVGRWRDLLRGGQMDIADEKAQAPLRLDAHEARIYLGPL